MTVQDINSSRSRGEQGSMKQFYIKEVRVSQKKLAVATYVVGYQLKKHN